MELQNPKPYIELVQELKTTIRKAQYEALKAVNVQLVNLYWNIGKRIVEEQNLHAWGKSVVEHLAADLQAEFVGMQGFSSRNIWRMRNFYLTYSQDSKLPPLVAEIGWAHNIVIMEKCKDVLQREFYILMTKKFGWTKNVLIHQIENQTYEKYLLNQTNFDQAVPEKYLHQAKLAVKDEYTFDFLELTEEHSEHELETQIVSNIRKFLIEMGGYFSFIGNQYRVEVVGNEYFIDLLLYHRKLRCLVAIELKISEFKPEYAGKMQFYLALLDDKVRLEDENPSIGIVVCKSKDKTVVEYALKNLQTPIGVATYQLTQSVPKELENLLPTPEQISQRLTTIFN